MLSLANLPRLAKTVSFGQVEGQNSAFDLKIATGSSQFNSLKIASIS